MAKKNSIGTVDPVVQDILERLVNWTRGRFEDSLHLRASVPSAVVREGKLLYAA